MTADVLGFERPAPANEEAPAERCGAPCPCGCGYACGLIEGHPAAHSAMVIQMGGDKQGWLSQMLHAWMFAKPVPEGDGDPAAAPVGQVG